MKQCHCHKGLTCLFCLKWLNVTLQIWKLFLWQMCIARLSPIRQSHLELTTMKWNPLTLGKGALWEYKYLNIGFYLTYSPHNKLNCELAGILAEVEIFAWVNMWGKGQLSSPPVVGDCSLHLMSPVSDGEWFESFQLEKENEGEKRNWILGLPLILAFTCAMPWACGVLFWFYLGTCLLPRVLFPLSIVAGAEDQSCDKTTRSKTEVALFCISTRFSKIKWRQVLHLRDSLEYSSAALCLHWEMWLWQSHTGKGCIVAHAPFWLCLI